MARTVYWYRRAVFLVALVLGLAGHGALAQPYTYEGETSVARATQGIADANGDIVKFRDMTIRWRFDVMMGSPLRQFAGRYTHYDPPWVELAGVQTCFAGRRIGAFRPLKLEPQMLTEGVLDQDLIYAHTRFNMILQPNARLSFMITGADRYIQHEFTVDTFSTGSEYGLSVPGSPEWDRMFQYGREGSPDNPWLTEAQAKELFAVGFTVSRIEMIEPRYALTLARASYERHFGASACGDEPAQTIAETEEQDEGSEDDVPARPSEPETPADRIAAMLTRVADAQQQAREEQARLEAEARQQEVAAAALVLPESGQGEPVTPAASTGGQQVPDPVKKHTIPVPDGSMLIDFECAPSVGRSYPHDCALRFLNNNGIDLFQFSSIRPGFGYSPPEQYIQEYSQKGMPITQMITDYFSEIIEDSYIILYTQTRSSNNNIDMNFNGNSIYICGKSDNENSIFKDYLCILFSYNIETKSLSVFDGHHYNSCDELRNHRIYQFDIYKSQNYTSSYIVDDCKFIDL